jgi:hypothetical protein
MQHAKWVSVRTATCQLAHWKTRAINIFIWKCLAIKMLEDIRDVNELYLASHG